MRVPRFAAAPCLMHALSAARLQAPPATPQAAARLHAASVASARRADRAAPPPSAAGAQRGPVSAVRPTPIKLITVSKGGSAALEEAVAEYTARSRNGHVAARLRLC